MKQLTNDFVRPGAVRSGFTLIELMITMLIIAMISAGMIAALSAARETARQIRTQQLITRLHAHMLPRYEAYRSRPLPIDPYDILQFAKGNNNYNSDSPEVRQVAWFRLWGMRELMRMELPDSYIDLFFEPQILRSPSATDASTLVAYVSPIKQMFDDEVNTLAIAKGVSLRRMYEVISESNASAECLYLIINSTVSDRDLYNVTFSEADVGDTDADNMPEFLDGWGRPIQFIRWPAGFESELQPYFRYHKDSFIEGSSIKVSAALGSSQPKSAQDPNYFISRFPLLGSSNSNRIVVGSGYHDAFDPYFADIWEPNPNNKGKFNGIEYSDTSFPTCSWLAPPNPRNPGGDWWGFPERSYNLFPLIFSAGADEEIGVAMFDISVSKLGTEQNIPISYPAGQNPYQTYTNPYLLLSDSDNDSSSGNQSSTAYRQRGSPSGGWEDNIHNQHLTGSQGLQ